MKSFSSRKGLQFGDYIVKADIPVYRPRSKGDSRIVVYPTFYKGKSVPTIEEGEPSDAFVAITVAEYVGGRGVHMMAQDRGDNLHPYQIFYDAIKDRVESDPKNTPDEWFRWMGKKVGGERKASKAILTRPKEVIGVQGMLIEQAGEVLEKPREHVLFLIPPSAKHDFLDGLCVGGDFEFISDGYELVIESTEVERNGRMQTSYKPAVGEKHKLDMDKVSRLWMPWEDVLNIEEPISNIISRLVDGFDIDSVVYAFKDSIYSSYVDSYESSVDISSKDDEEEAEEDTEEEVEEKAIKAVKKPRKKSKPVYQNEDDEDVEIDVPAFEEDEDIDEDGVPSSLKPVEEEEDEEDEEEALLKELERIQKKKKGK